MTSKRPYRDPLGEEDVRQEFLRCRGQQFDPMMVVKLLSADFWAKIFPPRTEARTTLTLLPSQKRRKKA